MLTPSDFSVGQQPVSSVLLGDSGKFWLPVISANASCFLLLDSFDTTADLASNPKGSVSFCEFHLKVNKFSSRSNSDAIDFNLSAGKSLSVSVLLLLLFALSWVGVEGRSEAFALADVKGGFGTALSSSLAAREEASLFSLSQDTVSCASWGWLT